jgi:glycosyltransferase involved in cell wall biosynthesis
MFREHRMSSFVSGSLRFALLSHVLPPSGSGQAVVLYRLLRDLDPAQYCVISVMDYPPTASAISSPWESANQGITQRLKVNYHRLPAERRFRLSPWLRWIRDHSLAAFRTMTNRREQLGQAAPRGEAVPEKPAPPVPMKASRFQWLAPCRAALQWMEDWLNMSRCVTCRAHHLVRILQQENCNALVACSGDLIDLPAACQAAQWIRIPFYVYLFDDYATHFVPHYQRMFAQRWTARLVQDAAGVIVPNEFLAQCYRQKFTIEPRIIPNPIEESNLEDDEPAPMGQPLRIVYTGAVYEAHYDAFHRLMAALRTLQTPQVELHIYTPMSREHLQRMQIGAPAVIHDAVPAREALRLQKHADVLFLPLAFESKFPEIVHTAAPGKMGELLASGRPVLVHAPKKSYVSWYFRLHACGAVVDEKDPQQLQQAIKRLCLQPEYVRSLVHKARQRARCDFDRRKAQQALIETLQVGAAGFKESLAKAA